MNAKLLRSRRLLFYTLFLAYISAGIIVILPDPCPPGSTIDPIAYISAGIIVILPGPTLPLLAAHTGVPLDVAGLSFTSSATGLILGVVIAGIVSNRIGPKYVLMAGLVLMAITTMVTPLTHIFPLLLTAQFVEGMGFGFLDVTINMIVTLAFEDTLGETLNNLHSSYGIGALIAPLVLSFALEVTHDPTWAYLVGSIVGLTCFFLLIRQRVPSVPKQNKVSRHTTASSKSIFGYALLWLMALQLALYVGAEVGFSNWLVTAISRSAIISLALAAPSATAFWLGLTIGRLLGAQLLKREILTENRLLYISALGSGISGLVVAVFIGNIGISFSVSAVVGLFLGPIFPGVMAIASRWFVHALSTVSAVLLLSAGVAAMILPVLMGFLIPHIGFNWVMAIPAFVSMSIVIPLSLAIRRQRFPLQLPSEVHTMGQEAELPITN